MWSKPLPDLSSPWGYLSMPLITVAITLTYTLVTGDKTETLGKDVANPTAELELDYRSPKSGKHTPPTPRATQPGGPACIQLAGGKSVTDPLENVTSSLGPTEFGLLSAANWLTDVASGNDFIAYPPILWEGPTGPQTKAKPTNLPWVVL